MTTERHAKRVVRGIAVFPLIFSVVTFYATMFTGAFGLCILDGEVASAYASYVDLVRGYRTLLLTPWLCRARLDWLRSFGSSLEHESVM